MLLHEFAHKGSSLRAMLGDQFVEPFGLRREVLVIGLENILSFEDGPRDHCLDLAVFVVLRARVNGVHVCASLRVVAELGSVLEVMKMSKS